MSLQNLVTRGSLHREPTSAREIADLLRVADRGIADAQQTGISLDLRFSAAYDAALTLATIPLRCAGYRTRGVGHHATTFEALPLAMGGDAPTRADLFEVCRTKRNVVQYRRSGEVSASEVEEIIAATVAFAGEVLIWLAATHPEYSPERLRGLAP